MKKKIKGKEIKEVNGFYGYPPPLSGLFPVGGKDGVACLLLTGPEELGFGYPPWAEEVVFMVTPHWAKEFMLTS